MIMRDGKEACATAVHCTVHSSRKAKELVLRQFSKLLLALLQLMAPARGMMALSCCVQGRIGCAQVGITERELLKG